MRYLIYSDVHANIDALRAVLRSVRRKRIDAAISLGDLVGYGAAPNQVLDAMRQMRGEVRHIRGNHDKVVAGIEEGLGFNSVALAAARWTRERLAPANLRLLRKLPPGPARENGFDFCHGSPLDEDAYVFSWRDAIEVFRGAEFDLCFFGHTHVAGCYAYGPDGLEEIPIDRPRDALELVAGVRYLVNPGAVGQPRDRDPRAAFVLYDSDRRLVQWFRVDYPIGRAQARILKAGLPKILADRLSRGA
ncbi:MAG TPA: metallophosphoesterase family protein [Thermoanaerobaculia bacterium]|nr:metallophosphoesterase family protein [Thermoanaerobaculia bacterium]